jgi:archaellum biogenesis protein FlaJ (TadC family)
MVINILFYLFLICLSSCASLILFFIWSGGPDTSQLFHIAASFFIVGLASFLTWFSLMLFELRDKIANRQ